MNAKISNELMGAVQMAELADLVANDENRSAGIDIPGFPGKKVGFPEAMRAENGTFLAVVEINGERLVVYQL